MKKCKLQNGTTIPCQSVKTTLINLTLLNRSCLIEVFLNATDAQPKEFKALDETCQKSVVALDLLEDGRNLHNDVKNIVSSSVRYVAPNNVALTNPVTEVLGSDNDNWYD